MRIIHIVSSLEVGGAERFVIDLASQQKNSSNHDVCILSMSNSGQALESEADVQQIKVYCVPNNGAVSQLLALRRTCRSFDIVHIHSSFSLPRILFAMVCLFKAPTLIYTRHNERVHKGLKWKIVYLSALHKLAKFVFVADKARINFLQEYSSMSTKCITILNGVLPIKRIKHQRQGLHIGQVGRFIPLKSQRILVKAVSTLPEGIQRQITLHFYGTGPLRDEIKALTKDPICKFSAIFHGHESDREKIYNSFGILVVTSETEGLSLAILEAMACGMPIIASNVGGNPELVEHNVNGYVYEYGDEPKLASSIQMLFQHPGLISVFSDASYEKYNEKFSMQICEQNYAKVYSEALSVIPSESRSRFK